MEQLHNQSLSVNFPAARKQGAFVPTAVMCFRLLAIAVGLLLIYRIALMLMLPLADTTEARYGEIARLTLNNGFWLMPHIDVNTPFFAQTAAVDMGGVDLNVCTWRNRICRAIPIIAGVIHCLCDGDCICPCVSNQATMDGSAGSRLLSAIFYQRRCGDDRCGANVCSDCGTVLCMACDRDRR
jgi:hypothetical protein